MTYVVMDFTPGDVGFAHPLSQELVLRATPYIRDQLNSVIEGHDDTETRLIDQRRTSTQLKESSWLIKLKGNKILITNQIADNNSLQFQALYRGNGEGPICAKHVTRHKLKEWGNNFIKSSGTISGRDRHVSVMRGGNKPVTGSFGVERPGLLKFYSKRDGMWIYRHCVRPISAAIVEDTDRQIRRAVFVGLEMARYELYDRYDKDSEGSNEPEDAGMSDEFTMEEVAYVYESKSKTDRDLEQYRMEKVEEEQVTMDSQVDERLVMERARGIIQSAGVEPPTKATKAKPENKSWFGRIKEGAVNMSESVADKVHRFMGVTK